MIVVPLMCRRLCLCQTLSLCAFYGGAFRMVEDEDEGALSDSEGQTGLAPDDLASK